MKIKTVLTILLVLATACLFTACGGGESDGGSGGGDYKTSVTPSPLRTRTTTRR